MWWVGLPGEERGERRPKRDFGGANIEMETFRIEVGHAHGVKPGNIVGAIANETGIDGDHIARIRIEDDYSTVELPAGMPKDIVDKYYAAIQKVTADPAVKKRIEETGSIINVNGPEAFAKEIKAEYTVYKEVVAKQKLQLD